MTLSADAQHFTLVFFRVISLLWFLPIFTYRFISVPYKAAFSLSMSYFLYETTKVGILPVESHVMLLYLVREMAIGLSIGFLTRIFFTFTYAAGEIISIQTGFSFARFMDPSMTMNTSIIEQFKNLLTVLVFFAIDGHHILFKAIIESVQNFPPGSFVFGKDIAMFFVKMTGKIFLIGLKLGAPVVATLFIVEIAFGLIVRMIPQVNIFIEGMPIKVFIALSVMAMSLGFLVANIADIFRGLGSEISRLITIINYGS